jgi:hypothetical protein
MKKLIFLLSVFIILSAGELSAQQSLRFGNVSLKDTTSGSIKHNSGGIYTDFVTTQEIGIKADAGDFIIAGQGDGLLMYMGNEIVEFYSQGINVFVPLYLNQYSTSEIGGLSVNNGAMLINSDTGELLIFLNDMWNTVTINPK